MQESMKQVEKLMEEKRNLENQIADMAKKGSGARLPPLLRGCVLKLDCACRCKPSPLLLLCIKI